MLLSDQLEHLLKHCTEMWKSNCACISVQALLSSVCYFIVNGSSQTLEFLRDIVIRQDSAHHLKQIVHELIRRA